MCACACGSAGVQVCVSVCGCVRACLSILAYLRAFVRASDRACACLRVCGCACNKSTPAERPRRLDALPEISGVCPPLSQGRMQGPQRSRWRRPCPTRQPGAGLANPCQTAGCTERRVYGAFTVRLSLSTSGPREPPPPRATVSLDFRPPRASAWPARPSRACAGGSSDRARGPCQGRRACMTAQRVRCTV